MPCMEGGETHVRMLHMATNSVGLRLCLPTDQTYDELTTGPCLRLSVGTCSYRRWTQMVIVHRTCLYFVVCGGVL